MNAMSGCPSGKWYVDNKSKYMSHTIKLGEIDRGHISKTQGCDINTSDLTTVPVFLVSRWLAGLNYKEYGLGADECRWITCHTIQKFRLTCINI
jgi:hypothetical protein